ncbi:Mov34/MPN/PAD-1 family protein [Roseospirillum parvum]|uniref:Proteasome lid subunit RPN8/RPN11, contains Jab1/MPN metalloenzyme (JAMM) motif n=1 Tax=Roseospirillum parvum TaxID=83401 RepID=A0A1G7Y786_9PROT|nr:M67 family metallopeptidase [Roseospirillum parvum]SDG92237.1 Proteasome lid subunit RPN8/RPN11, contains Jab1/MPN metalloenzyme (JAMM) motif [Roseospirillum parvum]
MSRLWLPKALAETMRAEARAAHPAECCGLLIGTGDPSAADGARVEEVVPAANLEASHRQDRFEIDPAIRLAVMRRLGQLDGDSGARAERSLRGPRLLGHYHSHPAGAAEPSETDRQRAEESGLVWLIIGAEGHLGAWLAEPDEAGRPSFRRLTLRLG